MSTSDSTTLRTPGPLLATLATLVLLSAAALAFGGCATTPTDSVGDSNERDVITREQLAEYPSQNLLEVIRRVRRSWIRTRGVSNFRGADDEVAVYIDGTREPNGANALRRLSTNNVERVDFLDQREAVMRFGYGHSAGAIMVTLIGRSPGDV